MNSNDNDSITICTCSAKHDDSNLFNFIVIVCALPVVCLVGVVANFYNIRIFSIKKCTSASQYLFALSISDFGICMSGIFIICGDSFRPLNHELDQFFVHVLPFVIPFGLFFQMLSVYITVFAGIDGFIGVSQCERIKNHQVKYNTIRQANKILMILVIFSALYNAVLFYELRPRWCYDNSKHVELFELCPTQLRLNSFYITAYKGIMYTFFYVIGPFTFLLMLTVAIIIATKQNARKANVELYPVCYADETPHSIKDEEGNLIFKQINLESDERSTGDQPTQTAMLISIVFLFLMCNSISIMANISEVLGSLIPRFLHMALIDIGNFLVVFNATANFFVYLMASPDFRNSFYSQIMKGAQ